MWQLDHKEGWALKNWWLWTVALEKTLESPLGCKEIKHSILTEISPEFLWRDWCWSWNSNTLVTWCEELTHLKRPWCWERLKVGGEGSDRGWDGGMASLTQWTWVEQAAGVDNGQGGLVCCSPLGRKELDVTEWLNHNWSYIRKSQRIPSELLT